MKSPVKKIREKVNLTQDDLANVLGTNNPEISKLERGAFYLHRSTDREDGVGGKKEGFLVLKNLADITEIDFTKLLQKQKEFDKKREETETAQIKKKLAETDFSIGRCYI